MICLTRAGSSTPGSLHQDFKFRVGAPVLLHHRFGQPQGVDAVLDRPNGAFDGVALDGHQFGGAHVHAVVGGRHRRQHPILKPIGDDSAQIAGTLYRHALDVDLDAVGILDPLRVVAVHTPVLDIRLLKLLFQAIDGLVGLTLQRVLHLDLQDQVAAAAQIEAQPYVVLNVGLQLGARLRDSYNAINTKQDCGNNDDRFRGQVFAHAMTLNTPLLLRFSGDQARHRAAGHLEFYVVGFHTQHQSVVFGDRHDGPDDAAASQHDVAVFEALQHLLLLLLLPLHGQEEQKVEDREDENNGEKPQERVWGTCLNQHTQQHFRPHWKEQGEMRTTYSASIGAERNTSN